MLRYSPKTSRRDAISAISYHLCLGTINWVLVQSIQNSGIRNSLELLKESITNATLDLYLRISLLQLTLNGPRVGSLFEIYSIFAFLTIFLLSLGVLSRRRLQKPSIEDETGNLRKYQDLRVLKDQHETAAILSDLVDRDGAGAWPPRANHDSWPAALKPYKDIYLTCVPLLPAANPSTDDVVNQERRGRYRSLMRKLLHERIDVVEVEMILKAVEAGDWNVCPRDAYNAVYCCLAVCRHAYR